MAYRLLVRFSIFLAFALFLPGYVLATDGAVARFTPDPLRESSDLSWSGGVAQVPQTPSVSQPGPVMPNVVGLTLRNALVGLRRMGIRVSLDSAISDQRPGTIVSQSLAPGSPVKYGTAVTLGIAVQSLVTVPALVGAQLSSVGSLLQESGLRLRNVTRTESVGEAGTVIGQAPRAGTRVARGSPVDVQVATAIVQRYVTVPDVLGRSLRGAAQEFSQSGLNIVRVDTVVSDRAAGRVVGQYPDAGTRVLQGTRAILELAIASPTVAVPNVVGRRVESARSLLDEFGLWLRNVVIRESTADSGRVLEQDPAAGERVRRDTPVDIVVSRRIVPESVTVPHVIAQRVDVAEARLDALRFGLQPVDTIEIEGPPGTVVRQSPAANTRVPVGTPVRLWVGIQLVAVPDLVGRTNQQVADLIRQAGLAIGGVDTAASGGADGTVLRQNPSAGTRVRTGSPVAFTVMVRQFVTVPDVRGKRLTEARNLLLRERLDAVIRDSAAGDVTSQSPRAGARVSPGTRVQLAFAPPRGSSPTSKPPVTKPAPTTPRPAAPVPPTSPETPVPVSPPPKSVTMIAVPDLIGLTLERARRTLDSAGLRAGETLHVRSEVPAGTIADHRPEPGAMVAPLTAVRLDVAAVPPSQIWRWILLSVAGLLAAGGAARLIRRPSAAADAESSTRTPRLTPVPPKVRHNPNVDVGEQAIVARGALLGSPTVKVLPKADAGAQVIEVSGPLLLTKETVDD